MSYDLNSITDDSILFFEYYTASGLDELCISSEAESLILALVEDLKEEDVYLLLNEKYQYIAKDLDNTINIILLNDDFDFEDFLLKDASKFNRTIFIASEEDDALYGITRFLEESNIKIYNSNAHACEVCSDKFEMFHTLKSQITQPFTFKITLDSDIYWKKPILFNLKANNMKESDFEYGYSDELFDSLNIEKKYIAKPVNGVDCENIKIIKSKEDVDDLENIFDDGSEILIQEYIEGEVLSVSLISDGDNAIALSLNKQFVNITDDFQQYLGGQLPYRHPAKDMIFDKAVKAVKSIEGIKGFVGVDLILVENDGDYEVYIIEINSRFTTPYVGLREVLNINIAKTILDLIDGKISIDDIDHLSFKNGVKFIKDNGVLKIISTDN